MNPNLMPLQDRRGEKVFVLRATGGFIDNVAEVGRTAASAGG